MALKYSELPEGIKEHLLSQIRDQIGSTAYDRIVDEVGEDGVIDALLQASNETLSSGSGLRKSERKGRWWKGVVVSLDILGGLVFAFLVWVFHKDEVASAILMGIYFGGGVILYFLQLVYRTLHFKQPLGFDEWFWLYSKVFFACIGVIFVIAGLGMLIDLAGR